jgi:hypothetical protein
MGMDEPPETGEYFVDLPTFFRHHRKIEDPDRLRDIDGRLAQTKRYPWAAADHPQIADWLAANEKPLALAVEAAKRPHYFSPLAPAKAGILGVISPAVMKGRAIANALASRAMLRVHSRKYDEAWQDLLACHRLGRHLARGGTFVELSVGFVFDSTAQRADLALLERADVDAQRLRGCLRDLQALPPMPSFADRLDTGYRFEVLEHVMFTDALGFWYVEGLAGGHPDKTGVPKGRLANINWDPGLRRINQWFDRQVAAAREPDRAARDKEFERIEAELEKEKVKKTRPELQEELGKAVLDRDITPEARGDVFSHVIFFLVRVPARKIQQNYDRQEQGERNLNVAFALAVYQRDNGSYPKSLDALAPKYLEKVPGDLFTSKPLVYRPTEKGFSLYSFGPDGKDDDGRGVDDGPRGDDLSVRIPLPEPKK